MRNPEFLFALAASLIPAAVFVRWLFTGGRKRRK
jgi:hypothetical protein